MAASWVESPITDRVSLSGVTVTPVTCCRTAINALSAIPPDVARTYASPSATAVTTPEPSTVATATSVDVHVKGTSGTAVPCASRAVAVSTVVSPRDVRVSAAGVTSTVSKVATTTKESLSADVSPLADAARV